MGRKYFDCREFTGDPHCDKVLTADTDDKLMEAVIKHAINDHGLSNTTDFRARASQAFKEGNPPH